MLTNIYQIDITHGRQETDDKLIGGFIVTCLPNNDLQ